MSNTGIIYGVNGPVIYLKEDKADITSSRRRRSSRVP